MIHNHFRSLPLSFMTLLFLAGCQADVGAPSDPIARGLEGAAKCKSAPLNNSMDIFPPSPDPRQGQVEDLCKAILDGNINPDLGQDQLLVLAYDGWKNGTLATGTGTSDIVAYNSAVRGLSPVAALEADEKAVWTSTNVSAGEFLAVGPIATSANPATFCFASGQWCFVINAGATYHFLAEAIAEQPSLGLCPGPLPNDCDPGGVHIDLNPDSVIDDDSDETNITVWSCTGFGTRHARFPISPDGEVGAGEYGEPATGGAPDGLNCLENTFLLNGAQQLVWTGLQPLRWVLGVNAANAGTFGTTFSRGSHIGEGEFGVPSARDLVCEVRSRFASVSEGTICRLYIDSTKSTEVTPASPCITSRVSQKVGSCTWEGVVVSNSSGLPFSGEDGEAPCLWGTVEKVENPSKSHFAEHAVCVGPGDPERGHTKTFVFDIR